jgi:hypothetical protein
MNDFNGMDTDTNTVQGVTYDDIMSKILMERDGGPVNEVAGDDGNNAVELTLFDAVNIALSLHHFLISWKDISDNLLESCDTVQEFTEKSLLKQRFQEKKDIFKK